MKTKTQDQLDEEATEKAFADSVSKNTLIDPDEEDDEDEDDGLETQLRDLEDDDDEEHEEEDGDEEDSEDDEEDGESSGTEEDSEKLSSKDRRLLVQSLRASGVTPDALVSLNDEALANMAEALSDGDDNQGQGAPATSQQVEDAFAAISDELSDEAGKAFRTLVDNLVDRTESAEEAAEEARAASSKFMQSTENEAFERARVKLQEEFPSLADPAVTKKLRTRMLKQAKTGDYPRASDLPRLMRDCAGLEQIEVGDREAKRSRKREKVNSDLRRKGSPSRSRRRSRSRKGGSDDDSKVKDTFARSVAKNVGRRSR